MSREEFVIPAPVLPVVPVGCGGLFPVRRIFCVGRNYAEHAREMGGDPSREPPFFFMKPADAVWHPHDAESHWPYPPATQEVHHEAELVVALRGGGRELSPEEAAEAIYGYAVGLDMTRRDLQAEAKAKGRPWDVAKGFDASLPISTILPKPGEVLRRGEIGLEVDGTPRQRGDLAQMIYDVPAVIAEISRYWRLAAGDLILTGTPAGVGPVRPGERVRAWVEGVGELAFVVGEAA